MKYLFFSFCLLLCLTSLSNAAPATVQGLTEPFRSATISAEIPGRISAIRIPEGRIANKGDTILEIEYAEDKLNADRAKLIWESTADVDAAKIKMETAKRDFEATKLVFDSTHAVSEEDVWKKSLDFNLAKADFDRLTMSEAKEKVEYQIALVRLKSHFVIAPYEGIVTDVLPKEWESCRAAEPLIKFADIHKCRFITYVPAARSLNLVKGKIVGLSIGGAAQPRPRTGTVDFVSPVVDQSSGLRTVKLLFDNDRGSVQPGVSGTMPLEDVK